MGECDEYLFDSAILNGWDNSLTSLIKNSNLTLRPLKKSDYDMGYLQLLSQLTTVGELEKSAFEKRFNTMKKCSDCYFILVLVDELNQKIAGTATLFVEFKFIHKAGLRARLEDVVVDEQYRGRQLGKLLVEAITQLAKKRDCYKISLDCSDKVMDFYKSIGYVAEEGRANMLVIRF